MAKKYRGRPPKIKKTIKGDKFSPDKFFGLSSFIKELFSTKTEKSDRGNIDNILPLEKFNIADIILPSIFDEESGEEQKSSITNIYNNIYKTYSTGGVVESFSELAKQYIEERSTVPSYMTGTMKERREARLQRIYGPFKNLSLEKLGSILAYSDEKSKIYEKINTFLRVGEYLGDDQKEIGEIVDNLKSVLNDLSSSNNQEEKELNRVVSGDYADYVSQLEPGEVIEEKGFGSWSGGEYSSPKGDQFIKKDQPNAVLTTKSNKAIDISPISKYEREAEHLLYPGQKYEVLSNNPEGIYSRKTQSYIPRINLRQFAFGGKVTTQSGKDIKGAGVDTQLIAARPGEVVINKETVDKVGSGFFLGLNKKYGGQNANKPKIAKNVQTASGGGLINLISSFANGGKIKYRRGNIKENLDKIRQEITEEGTIGGERLTPEQRKEAFKSRRDKVAFKNFVENFLGVKNEPKTQTGGGSGRGGGVGAPPSGPRVKMLPGTSVAPLTVTQPDTQKQTVEPEPDVQKVKVEDVTKKKKTKVGDSLEKNVKIIRKTVDSIYKTLSDQNKFFGKQAENERKALENQRRVGKEERFEEGKNKKFKKAFEKTVKPFSNILDGILNYLTAVFLGRAFIKLMNWFSDPDNQSKVESIGRFLKDWWPALLGAYLIFGNSFTRFVIGFIAKVGMWTARMAVAVIPKLLAAIAKNPKAAAAVGLFTAGATIPMLFPQTVNEQERATEKAVAEKGADKVRADLERKANNPNFYEKLTGQDVEAREQLFKMETGETKSYGFRRGGKITTQSGRDVKGAGVDTQLIAARPGEVVINKETVDRVGAEYFLSLNKKYGGPNANKPKVAKNVQAASGGGLVLPAFVNGGMVGGETAEIPVGGTYMGQRGKRLERQNERNIQEWAKNFPGLAKNVKPGQSGYNAVQKQSTGSLLNDPMGALGRIASRTGISIPKIGGISLPQLDKIQFPSFGGDERPREPGKSSTGSLLNDPIGALGRITSGTGMQIPRVPQVKIPPLPSLSTITGGMMGKPSAPKPPASKDPNIGENMLKSPTFRDSGLLYLRSMLGGLGGPITEQQLSKESKTELESAISRAKLRTSSELKVAEAQLKEAKDKGFNKQILAERQSVVNRLKSGQVRVKYQDYFEDGKISKSAEDAKSILGQFWAQATSDGGYRVVNEKYDFVEMSDPLAVLRGDSTGVAKDAKPGQPITLRQKLQALHQLNPLARSMEVDMILGNKKGDPGRTLINTARAIAMSTQPGMLIGGMMSMLGGEKDEQQKPTQTKRKTRQQRRKDDINAYKKAMKPTASTKATKSPYSAPGGVGPTIQKPKTNQQKLIEKRPWYDKFGWFGGASRVIQKKQGGGMVGPSWLPWNWGKAVERGRDEASLGGKAFGYNARYKNVTDPEMRRMLGLPPLGKKQGGGITENTGMDIPGATADRQLIATQPGEYILPFDTVMKLGGPNAIDRLVASTDSNSTAAKLGVMSKQSMAVEQPVMFDDMSMVSTLPPIIQSSGDSYGGGGGVASKIPDVSVSSNSSRRNAKTMYGLV